MLKGIDIDIYNLIKNGELEISINSDGRKEKEYTLQSTIKKNQLPEDSKFENKKRKKQHITRLEREREDLIRHDKIVKNIPLW